MQLRIVSLALLAGVIGVAAPGSAAPRLEIGALARRITLPGIRSVFVARVAGDSNIGLRFVSTGAIIYWLDPAGRLWPVMYRTELYGTVTDPAHGALLCTSRGVYATRDGRFVRKLSNLVFTKVVAPAVGGLFVREGSGLYGFDGEQFQLIRSIPWQQIDSLAIEPGGSIWFVGTYTSPDGSPAPRRLYVSRERDGQPVIDDPLLPEETASSVAEYFGGIVSTIDGRLKGTVDGGANWVTFDWFGRSDLTLTSVPLFESPWWQALWIGVREPDGTPAPLWFDDYSQGLVAQPIDALIVRHVASDMWRGVILFVADDTLFEASYRILDEPVGP